MSTAAEFPIPNEKRYSLSEEVANAVTHGVGALLSAAALVLLVLTAARRDDKLGIVAYAIFGASLILLFTASTVYHAVTIPAVKKKLKLLDHSSIYVLIAGTYTPFCLTILRGPLGWTLFGLVWGFAILGISLKLFFINRFRILSTLGYVAMGWLIIFAIRPLHALLPPDSLVLLISGGLCYTLGSLVYLMKRLPWTHAIWHLFVLGGAICHVLSALAAIA